jgi:hypothetical protein
LAESPGIGLDGCAAADEVDANFCVLGHRVERGDGILDFVGERGRHLSKHGEALGFQVRDDDGPCQRE